MKRNIGIETVDEMRKLKLERARQIDHGLQIKPESRIMFERAEDLLQCLSPLRVHLLAAARKKEMSITELAKHVSRPRTAVQRDLKVLCGYGLVQMRKRSNPGHGQVQMVRTIAERFTVQAYV